MNRVRLGRRLLLGVISAGILAAVLAPAASAHSVSVTMTCSSVTYSDFKSFPGPENVTFTAFVNNVQVAQTNANVTDSSDPVMLTFTAPPGMDDIEANAYDNTEGSPLPGFPQDTRLICGLPVATMPPSITGATRQRSALTLTRAQWSNAPTSIADQWERCDSAGAYCTTIGGATADTYQLSSLDVGHTIRVSETATNAAGASSPSNSAATDPVAPPVALPVATMPPSITGATRQRSALTLTRAQWSNAPTSIADQWSGARQRWRLLHGDRRRDGRHLPAEFPGRWAHDPCQRDGDQCRRCQLTVELRGDGACCAAGGQGGGLARPHTGFRPGGDPGGDLPRGRGRALPAHVHADHHRADRRR